MARVPTSAEPAALVLGLKVSIQGCYGCGHSGRAFLIETVHALYSDR